MNLPKVPIGEILIFNDKIYLGTINGNVDITQKKDYFFIVSSKEEIANLTPEERNTKNLYFSINDCIVYSFVSGLENANIKPIVMNVNCFEQDTQEAKFWYNITEGSLKYRNNNDEIIDLNAVILSVHDHTNLSDLEKVSGSNTGDETKATIEAKLTGNITSHTHNYEPTITSGTTSQYYRGDKTFQILDKTAVGLSNVVNIDTSNPANIAWTASHRTVTDTEKTAWNAKVSSSDVVTTATANKILKLDANAKLPTNITGNADGNSATATKLQTARTINGVSFDGSANITINAVDSTPRIASTEKGAINGVATLDTAGKVPASQLPSYVDDVLEYANYASFPATGEASKIYVDLATNKCYRWGGSAYIYITSGAVDSINGQTGVVVLTKSDVGLGSVANLDTSNPANITWSASYRTVTDTEKTTWNGKASTVVATTSANGLMSSTDKTKLNGIAAGANNYAHPTGDGNSHIPVTGTTNNGKVLKAGATANSVSWSNVDWSEIVNKPASMPASDVSAWAKAVTKPSYTFSEITSKPTTLSGYGITDAASLNHEHTLQEITNIGITNFTSLVNSGSVVKGFGLGKGTMIGAHQTFAATYIGNNVYHDGASWKANTAEQSFLITSGKSVFQLQFGAAPSTADTIVPSWLSTFSFDPNAFTTNKPIYFGDSNCKVYMGTNKSVVITNNNGYCEIGPQNISFNHFITNRDKHHFNKPVCVAGDIYAGTSYDKKVYHEGNKPSLADLGAASSSHAHAFADLTSKPTTLSGYGITDAVSTSQLSSPNVASKVVQRDGSGDIVCRLVRAEYQNQSDISGGLVFRTAGGSGTDNYLRVCNNVSAIRTFLGTPSTAVATTSANGLMSSTDKTKLNGIAAGANNYTHPASGITSGTYTKVTVDANGHATAGTNPTTLSGYGITDAINTSDVVTTATANKILKLNASAKLPASITGNADGNAATATKLQTARTINGVSFDGSANITLPVATISADGLMSATDKATLDSISLTAGNTISYKSVNIAANVSATIASLKRQSCKIQVVAYRQSPTTVNTTGRYAQSPYIDIDDGTEGCIYEFSISEISKTSYQWALLRGANSRDYMGSFNVALMDDGTTLSLIVKPSSAAQVRAVATYF